MTIMRCSTGRDRLADPPAEPASTGNVLQLATRLRDDARLSAHNVIVLGEQIGGRRAAAARPHAPQPPLLRWLEAHRQMALRAMTGSVAVDSPLAAVELWGDLTGRWLDANLTLAASLLVPNRA